MPTTSMDSAAAVTRKSDIPSKDEVTALRLQEENGHFVEAEEDLAEFPCNDGKESDSD